MQLTVADSMAKRRPQAWIGGAPPLPSLSLSEYNRLVSSDLSTMEKILPPYVATAVESMLLITAASMSIRCRALCLWRPSSGLPVASSRTVSSIEDKGPIRSLAGTEEAIVDRQALERACTSYVEPPLTLLEWPVLVASPTAFCTLDGPQKSSRRRMLRMSGRLGARNAARCSASAFSAPSAAAFSASDASSSAAAFEDTRIESTTACIIRGVMGMTASFIEPTNDAMQMSAMPRTPGSSASCARSTIGGIA